MLLCKNLQVLYQIKICVWASHGLLDKVTGFGFLKLEGKMNSPCFKRSLSINGQIFQFDEVSHLK